MSSKRTIALAVFTLLMTGSRAGLMAQEPTCLEHILVPIRADQVPGANGSLWQSFLTITNHSESTVPVGGIGECSTPFPPCMVAVLPPDTTITPRFYDDYIVALCEDVAKLDISLRVRDLSRALDTWGTTIPVVYKRETHHGIISITDIPNTPEFRSMLRIYGVEEGTEDQVHLTFFAVAQNREPRGADEPLVELDVLVAPEPTNPLHSPGLAEIPLQSIPELQNADVIRVEIEGSEGVGLWAMVSATNNHTQHVTMLWPKGPQQ